MDFFDQHPRVLWKALNNMILHYYDFTTYHFNDEDIEGRPVIDVVI